MSVVVDRGRLDRRVVSTRQIGHFGCTCYRPLLLSNQFGDLERSTLQPDNVHSAAGWRGVLEPVIVRYWDRLKRRYFCADAAFAKPEIYELLEAEGYKYAIQLPVNAVLQERTGWLLKRPMGRPANDVRRFQADFRYQAGIMASMAVTRMPRPGRIWQSELAK